MLFDMTASTNIRKLMVLNPEYPKDVTVKAGTDAVFSAVIEKDGRPTEYTYKWYVNDTPVDNVNTAVYTKKTDSDKGVYTVYCEITNKAGSVTTRTATLTVNALPKLDSAKPVNASCYAGQSKTLEVAITEHGYPEEYTYQWYKNSSKISGATSPTYAFTPNDVGQTTFYCTVTNSSGTVTSRTATVEATRYYIFKNGVFANGGSFGYNTDDDEDYVEVKDGLWHMYDESTGGSCAYTTKKYDFTGKDKLYFVCAKAHKGGDGGTFNFGVASSISDYEFVAKYSCPAYTSSSEKTFTVDVSKLTGSYYVKFTIVRDVYYNDDIYISEIYF